MKYNGFESKIAVVTVLGDKYQQIEKHPLKGQGFKYYRQIAQKLKAEEQAVVEVYSEMGKRKHSFGYGYVIKRKDNSWSEPGFLSHEY